MRATLGAVMAGKDLPVDEQQTSQPHFPTLGQLLQLQTAASHIHLTGDLKTHTAEPVCIMSYMPSSRRYHITDQLT
jgi:hypothetical protein